MNVFRKYWTRYLEPWQRWSDFDGRATRREYFYFTTINLALFAMPFIIGIIFNLGELHSITMLPRILAIIIAVPTFTLTFRRLHDANFHGAWALMPIINFWFCFIPGSKGDNRYGPNPRLEDGDVTTLPSA